MIVSKVHSICTHHQLTIHHLSFCTGAVDRTPRFQSVSVKTNTHINSIAHNKQHNTFCFRAPERNAYVGFSCEFEGATFFGATMCLLVWLIFGIGHETFASLQSCVALVVEDFSAAQCLLRVHVRQKVQNDASRFRFTATIFAEYADALVFVLIL